MRYPIAAALLLLVINGFPAAVAAPCEGAACSALKLGADGCSWTNAGDKSVRLAVNRSDSGAPLVTVLAPGEQFKAQSEYCSKSAPGGVHYEASFPVLRTMPGEAAVASSVAIATPRAKPAPPALVADAPAAAPTVVAMTTVPLARAKPTLPPAYPPLPRAKPELPVVAAAAIAPALTVPATPVVGETRATSEGSSGCGDACGEILFKQVDSCIWVQSQNPRPISFEASIKGKAAKLRLEGANGAKADVRAAVLAKAGADAGKADAAYHARLRDPFQSASAGIPVYRARLEVAGTCVKSRDEITMFAARFAN